MKVEKINIQKWNAYLKQCSTATFFHTPDWYELWRKYKGMEYQAFKFEFPSGNSALLPLAKEKKHRNLFTHTISSPAGTYGGPITNDNLTPDEKESIEQHLSQYSYITVRNNPLNPILKNLINISESTQIIDLRQGWEAQFKEWSKGHASAAKKSRRDGITFRPAQLKEWESYFDIYQKTLSRWDHPPANPYSWELFSIIKNISDRKCKLWLAFKEDIPIAGALCFYFQQHVVYWHGASLKTYEKNKPGHGLQMKIIKDAIQKGYRWYDFNPSGRHEGVVHFKKGFGATFQPADVYSNTPLLLNRILSLRSGLTKW